jgi:activating signal cointegrator 1
LRAISLWQPWATLIAIGAKRIETRSWDPGYAPIHGPIAIHASKRVDRYAFRNPFINKALFDAGISVAGQLPRGAIVAVCDLDASCQCYANGSFSRFGAPVFVGAPECYFGDYAAGRYAWMLSNLRKLEKPVPFRGRQKWFHVPDDLLSEVA